VTGRRGGKRKQLLDDLNEREDNGNWKRKHCVTICAGLAVEETMDM